MTSKMGVAFVSTSFERGAAIRSSCERWPSEVPNLEQLEVPEILQKIPPLNNGLVLVTGATGSGKSTTLAAILDRINRTRAVHIVTLEDPVEFAHQHRQSIVNQRELEVDFGTFADGLRARASTGAEGDLGRGDA